jgi:phosphoglycolate phosphatase
VRSRVLLFDLDGTLTDSRPGIVACLRHALEQLGQPCPPDRALAASIGLPLREALAGLLERADAASIETAVMHYRQRYARDGLYASRVYHGIPAMLERVRGRVCASFVATAKLEAYARRIVDHLQLAHHFAGVYGSEPDGRRADKTALLAHVLAREGIPEARAIMVGDRAVDIVAARANAVQSVGVLWGYGSRVELHEAGADVLCEAPADLTAWVTGEGPRPGGGLDPRPGLRSGSAGPAPDSRSCPDRTGRSASIR